MRGAALALRQVGFESRSMARNPASAFFTFIFPLMFLVIFTLIFGNNEIEVEGGTTTVATFYVASIIAFSVINACYTSVAMNVAFARDLGLLKRLRGTPLPAWALIAGKVGHSILVAYGLSVIVAVFGWVFYDVTLPTQTLPAAMLAIAVGAATFAALGLAVAGIIPNADAAPAVVNGVILPLLFISDVFIPLENAPSWLATLANVFPVRHLSEALQTAFNPFLAGWGFEWADLGVVALWGLIGVALASRTFKWETKR
jgi:ABC-2 type transport system permease protein